MDVIETTLLRGKVKLLQPKVGFHASIDTVFLAAAAGVKDRQKLLDIGCGVGSAGLCSALINNNILLTGLDIQEELIDIAHQNARLNGIDDRCHFFAGNLLVEKQVPDNEFHVVLMNPPYQEAGTHTPSPRRNKALSHGEDASGASLTDWVKYAHRKLKQGGYLVTIHRADRMDDLINALTVKRWFGSLEVYPLFSKKDEIAKRVIIRARKERYAPIKLLPGMVIHKPDGKYTPQANDVLQQLTSIF